jgi:ferritin
MKLDPAMLEALQQQVTIERQNAVDYAALAIRAEMLVLPGLAKFMRASSAEETEHAQKFTDYLIDRNDEPLTVALRGYDAPVCTMQTAGRVLLSQALALEQMNTARIKTLVKMALDTVDDQSLYWLNWASQEQLHAERELTDMIAQWTYAEGCPAAILALDHELGE